MKRTRVAARVDFPDPEGPVIAEVLARTQGEVVERQRRTVGPPQLGTVHHDAVAVGQGQGSGGVADRRGGDGEPVEALAGRACAHRQGAGVGQPADGIGQGERHEQQQGQEGGGGWPPGRRGRPRRPRPARLPRWSGPCPRRRRGSERRTARASAAASSRTASRARSVAPHCSSSRSPCASSSTRVPSSARCATTSGSAAAAPRRASTNASAPSRRPAARPRPATGATRAASSGGAARRRAPR